jgi:6-phosphogluconate dehydrogenase
MAAPEQATGTAQIGVTGMGVMGRNLARNFARHGFSVALHNRTASKAADVARDFGDEGTFVATQTASEFVAALERPRRLVIMVNAGAATDAVIDEFAPLLEPGDMIIDAGNAHFKDTRRREAKLKPTGVHFVGMGVSGGEEGALHGPSIMPGVARADARGDLGQGGRHALLHLHRPRWRRALREDGAQRHRVRGHAADRRGV